MLFRSFFAQITRLSLRFKWVTIALTIAFLVLGVIGAVQLNQDLLPDIEFPQTFIVTFRPGASNDDLLNLITIPLENALAEIEGVIPAGLESTTGAQGAPVAFMIIRSEFGIPLASIRPQIEAAVERVLSEDVPPGLRTTADLTPDLLPRIEQVLRRAPSMWAHFEARHLLAMEPDILDALLAVNPEFINQIDVLTRDQLAAERLNEALGGTPVARTPVQLPQAWRIGQPGADQHPQGFPRLITFNLASDIPVISASVSSTDPNLTPEQLRALVQDSIAPALRAVPGVANVSVSGGQQIPPEVMALARQALESSSAEPIPTPAPTAEPAATPAPGNPEPATAEPVRPPALPGVWRASLPLVASLPVQLEGQFGTRAAFDTAEDLLSATDSSGEPLQAAALLSQIAELPLYRTLLRDYMPAEVLAYLRDREPGFSAALSEAALELLAASALRNGAWAQLLEQPAFQEAGITNLRDLSRLGNGAGSVAAALNTIAAQTPAALESFAIRLVDGLTPEAIRYILMVEPDFLSVLDPGVWRYMSAATLRDLSDAVGALNDADLRAELEAIASGAQPSAAARLESGVEVDEMPDDPNAPLLPPAWVSAPGLSLRTAQDFLRKPFGLSAGAFINAAADSPQGGAPLIGTLTPEILLYVQAADPTFFDTLRDSTLSLLAPETLDGLPAAVQARVRGGEIFRPTQRVTRTDGRDNLILTVNKASDANTVQVYHAIEDVFERIQETYPDIQIGTIFEQASFIEESISGVAREGGLGAIMAVVVILLFLNFSVRSTLVTAVSIPASVAIAFVLMRWVPVTVHEFLIQPGVGGALPGFLHDFLLRLFPASITLNIMTLSGLTVAIGRVVDDSIVVLENIYRQLQKGVSRKEAVITGTREVSLAIFAATLTTIVVFLPIGLTGGVVGEFFLPFGMAVSYALGASFVVAISVVPLLAFLFIDPKHLPEEKDGPLVRVYHRVLEWSLNRRPIVLALAALTLVAGLVIFTQRPTTFLPALGEPQISIDISLPPDTTLPETNARVQAFETYLETLRDSGVHRYQTTVGSAGAFGDIAALIGGSSAIEEASASITLAVDVRDEALADLTVQVREQAAEFFGAGNVTVSRASLSERGFGGFEVVASGPQEVLLAFDEQIAETLASVPGLANVTSTASQVGDSASYLRVGRTNAIRYSAELEVTDTLGVTRRAIEAVQSIPGLPESITVGEGFQSQVQTEGFAQTFSAMGIAVVAVYLVMVFTFNSLIHPFTILFSLPLAVVGAAIGLWITDRVVGISALVGLLMLIGIVVTNAIVMIDRVQQNRKEKGMPPREALVEGARTRLRPILMTAIATMFALLPLAIGFSQGAIIAAELGTVVIGGLFSSTVLTLLVVPVVYSIFDGIQRRIMRRRVTAPAPTGD